jgi:predicted NBD/HSP70 family sugar kinase
MTEPTRLRASSDGIGGRLVAGVDVGGTKVAALVVDDHGVVAGRAVRPMDGGHGPASVAPVVGAVHAALRAASASPASLSAVGVGVPGQVDPAEGIVRVATNLGWTDIRLGELIADAFGAPSAIENDARVAAAGLVDHEVAGGARSLAYVAIGTGIGAGIVLNGRLHRGDRGMAGEIGHVIADPAGVVCRCGQRGCLETIASGPFVARAAAEAIAEGATSTLAGINPVTAEAVYDAARDGDELALRLTETAGRALARAIAGLVLTCDLERVLLGGGVSAAGEIFFAPIQAELAELRRQSSLVAELLPVGSVRLLPPHFDAVAWGGVALARALVKDSTPTTTAEEEVIERESQP